MFSPKYKPLNSIITLLVLLNILHLSSSLEFTIQLAPQQRFCFYQVFEAQQKYTYVATPENRGKQQVQVSHIDGRQWKSLFFKASGENEYSTRVDKLASASTTYSFCVRSLHTQPSRTKIQFISGMDVLELNTLPDSTDGDNLQRQLTWLEKQTNILSDKAQNIEGLRRINFQINGMVGVKMTVFAIIGLVGIGVVNFGFYRVLKNQLKKRKLI